MFGFWLNSLGVFAASSDFWIQFLYPIIFERNLWRWSRWHICFLAFDFSIFHHNNFRDSIYWECVVKDDCITFVIWNFNCLRWKNCVSTQYTASWCLCHFSSFAWCKTWFLSNQTCTDRDDPYSWDSKVVKNTVCLSLLEFVLPKSILHLWWSVLNDLGQFEDEEFLVLVSTTLKSILVASPSCHFALPHFIKRTLRVLKRSEDHLLNLQKIPISSSRRLSMSKKSVQFFFATGCAWFLNSSWSACESKHIFFSTQTISVLSQKSPARGRCTLGGSILWSTWSLQIQLQC